MKELLRFIDWRYQPIPEIPSVAGWKEGLIQECGEPLVSLGILGEYSDIAAISMYGGKTNVSAYFGKPIKGSLEVMFVRKGTADKIRVGQSLLPEGKLIVVQDAFRSIETQASLYQYYYNQLKEIHPDWNEDDLSNETQRFVSLPSLDPTKPSPHNTGGAVDLTIVQVPRNVDREIKIIKARISEIGHDQNNWEEVYALEMRRNTLVKQHGRELDFGTAFDNASEQSGLRFYEDKKILTSQEITIRENRRLLYNVFKRAGFEFYPDEWWHVNDGNQMAAQTSGAHHAIYGAIELTDEQLAFEYMRQQHLIGSEHMREGAMYAGGSLREAYVFGVAQQTALRNPSLREVVLMRKGEKIAPIAA